MKEKLRNYFAFSEGGMNNTLAASRWSFLKFLSFVFPPMLTFFFLQDVGISDRHFSIWEF